MNDDLSKLEDELSATDTHHVTTLVCEGEKFASVMDIVTWLMKTADDNEERLAQTANSLRLVAKTLALKLL